MRVWILLFVILLIVPTRAEYVSGTATYSCFRGSGAVDTGYQVFTVDRPDATANLAVVNVTSSGSQVGNYTLLWTYAELYSPGKDFVESNSSKVSAELTTYQGNESGLVWRLQLSSDLNEVEVCVRHVASFTFEVTHVFVPLTGDSSTSAAALSLAPVLLGLFVIRRWHR